VEPARVSSVLYVRASLVYKSLSPLVRTRLAQVPLDTPVCEVMSKTLHLATPDMTRDGAAEVLQKHKIHHAVVQNIEGKFAGVFSSWDIARECALDAKVRPPSRPVPRDPRARLSHVFPSIPRCVP
jgi:CBS domain-containing protein